MISLANKPTAEYCFGSFLFASQRLQDKKTSPRTYAFLEYTKKTCLRAYENPEDQYLRVKVATCVDLLHSKAFLLRDPCNLEEDLANELKGLRRLQFLANYGDYAKVKLTDLRVSARKIPDTIPGIEELTSSTVFFTTIQKQLEKESQAFELLQKPDFDTPENFTPLPAFPHMHNLIHTVCTKLQYNPEYIKRVIALYAERNGQVHSDIIPFIENCNFIELGLRLFHDTEDLKHDLEEQDIDDAQDRMDILSTITELTQKYFVCISKYAEDIVISNFANDTLYTHLHNKIKKEKRRIAKEKCKEELERWVQQSQIESSKSSSQREALQILRQGRASARSSEDWSSNVEMNCDMFTEDEQWLVKYLQFVIR